jgi:aspartyl-tRNA(Asn)/glutamyl-tRNA(Gln) amidotransferase subunit C
MAFITREEILKVARMSHIELTEQEIEKMQVHVEAVLSYAARVQDIAKDVSVVNMKNSNIERDDRVIPAHGEKIRAQAPEREGDYFVVPAIIETT